MQGVINSKGNRISFKIAEPPKSQQVKISRKTNSNLAKNDENSSETFTNQTKWKKIPIQKLLGSKNLRGNPRK